jgi:hypothetical protein
VGTRVAKTREFYVTVTFQSDCRVVLRTYETKVEDQSADQMAMFLLGAFFRAPIKTGLDARL